MPHHRGHSKINLTPCWTWKQRCAQQKPFLHCTIGTCLYEVCKRHKIFLKFNSLVTASENWAKFLKYLYYRMKRYATLVGSKLFNSTSLRQLKVHPRQGEFAFYDWYAKDLDKFMDDSSSYKSLCEVNSNLCIFIPNFLS